MHNSMFPAVRLQAVVLKYILAYLLNFGILSRDISTIYAALPQLQHGVPSALLRMVPSLFPLRVLPWGETGLLRCRSIPLD